MIKKASLTILCSVLILSCTRQNEIVGPDVVQLDAHKVPPVSTQTGLSNLYVRITSANASSEVAYQQLTIDVTPGTDYDITIHQGNHGAYLISSPCPYPYIFDYHCPPPSMTCSSSGGAAEFVFKIPLPGHPIDGISITPHAFTDNTPPAIILPRKSPSLNFRRIIFKILLFRYHKIFLSSEKPIRRHR